MSFLGGISLALFADASIASDAMRSVLTPIIATLCGIATLACTFFLVTGGIEYMSSRGKPENLEHAKKVIKNALIGLVMVIAAAALTAILSHAYTSSSGETVEKLPTLASIEQQDTSFWELVVQTIVQVLLYIIDSVGQPFVQALGYFTNSTPLMGNNPNVFNLWLAVVAIADVLFVLAIALLGFHVMSFSTFGFDELDIKQILPQIALVFLLINTSIFIIDAVIGLSNGIIRALQSGFPCTSIWDQLSSVTEKSAELGLGGLLVMIAFLVLTVMLLVYYVGRLITLYIGAILSPLVLLLYLLPAFKDFTINAIKVYLTVIFVLFVQVLIMQLASSIFSGMLQNDSSGQPNMLMALILGLATLLALLKTQGVMKELSYAASTPRAAREVAGSFMRGISYFSNFGSSRRRGRGRQEDDEEQEEDKNKKKKRRNNPDVTNEIYQNNTTNRRTSTKPEITLRTGETRKMQSQSQEKQANTENATSRSNTKQEPKKIKREVKT